MDENKINEYLENNRLVGTAILAVVGLLTFSGGLTFLIKVWGGSWSPGTFFGVLLSVLGLLLLVFGIVALIAALKVAFDD